MFREWFACNAHYNCWQMQQLRKAASGVVPEQACWSRLRSCFWGDEAVNPEWIQEQE